MNMEQFLEDLVEARLQGRDVDVPAALQADFDNAMAAHAAIEFALHETIVVPDTLAGDGAPPPLPSGYEIIRELGRGGMGVVYLASQESLGRSIAVKVLRPGQATFGPLVRRFLDEARHLARLRHPNIVSIHEIGEANGEPYFTMDFIDGEPLSDVIGRGAMSPTQALEVFKQVAAAIQHAHRQGIVHRDLKPSNVLIDRDGNAFVTDFGLARDISQSPSVTRTGELLGTPQYMSPEQARGQTSLIGEATDIHALGLLLFEMLTGRPTFASAASADVLVKLLHEEAPRLRQLDRRIPRDLETICATMLQKSPDARYPGVSALLEDIHRYERGEPLKARRTPWLTCSVRWCGRHWRSAAVAVGAAAITAILAMLIARPWDDPSYDELIAWGDEEIAAGHQEVAAQVYLRAFHKATEADKLRAADRIALTCQSMEDPQAAVELAMQVIDVAPSKSFGRHNYLVAKTLVAREHAAANLGTVNIWHTKPKAVLRLVKSRLELALASELPEAQKLDAEQILVNVNLAISEGSFPVRYQPEYLYQLPTGDVESLRQLQQSDTEAAWKRGLAGIALGRLLEQERNVKGALIAYRQAYEQVRRVYPMYAGVKVAGGGPSRIHAPDAEECVLVRELVQTLHRLDPAQTTLPTGQIEFEVLGLKLPPTVQIELELRLCDPSVSDPNQGLPHNLPRLVPLHQDGPVSVTVLDGVYRLDKVRNLHMRWDAESENMGRLLQVDVPNWPEEIVVRGKVVKLPPVRLRMAQPIELRTPASGAALNLADAELTWSAVPQAASYRLYLSVRKERPTPTSAMFFTRHVAVPQFRFADLEAGDRQLVRENLIHGSVGEWRVDALDSEGKSVGKSLREFRFIVAEPLAEPAVSAEPVRR